MFKNIKISTAMALIIVMFTLALVSALLFCVVSQKSSRDHFNDLLVLSTAENEMRDSMLNLKGALANINALMLQRSLNKDVREEYLESSRIQLIKAKEVMNGYMKGPFYTAPMKDAADELNKRFEVVYTLSMNKIAQLKNANFMTLNIDIERQQLSEMHNQILISSELNSNLSRHYAESANVSFRSMVIITVLGGILSLVMMVGVRLWLRRILIVPMKQTTHFIRLIANGDLSKEIVVGRDNELGQMLHEVEKMRLALTSTVSGIRESATHIHSHAREVAKGNTALSSRTEEQASALQQTAASMEEIKTTVRQNADNVHNARELAENASVNAHNGGKVMTNLEEIMQQISKSSRQIADINNVIDGIAKQTNILSLNAAVEAARAGEQGRGFAVVAEEVRHLAKRSADAAKEINDLIVTCVTNMETGSHQVHHASTVMDGIVSSIKQVTDIMGEISSASDEQSAGINQISQAVNQMDLVTQQNTVMVEEGTIASSNLEAQSDSLNKLVSLFSLNEAQSKSSTILPVAHKPSARISRSVDKASDHQQEDEWETF